MNGSDEIKVEPESFYSTDEAAQILGVSVSSLRQWRSRGVGPCYYKLRSSRECRYKGRDLVDWQTRDAERVQTNVAAEAQA